MMVETAIVEGWGGREEQIVNIQEWESVGRRKEIEFQPR